MLNIVQPNNKKRNSVIFCTVIFFLFVSFLLYLLKDRYKLDRLASVSKMILAHDWNDMFDSQKERVRYKKNSRWGRIRKRTRWSESEGKRDLWFSVECDST